ncbi:MAG: DEAD/DEAH box helicase [Deltaproteobacteria bacterium]|nr:DEAD/DEAH box helicase [Deltaproteobacteria bacterium]
MRLVIRNKEWLVRRVETNPLGNKVLHALGLSPFVNGVEATFLSDLENIEQIDPAQVTLVPDDSHAFITSLLYVESQWRQKIPTDSAIHIGHRAAMDTMEFQLTPASLALRKPKQRILIADSVGLGKTLEAGILLSELIVRAKAKRILVITVKSMMAQFQKEMWNRFSIPLVRLDSNRIQRIRAELPANHNPFYFYNQVVVSIDTIKRDLEYRAFLDNSWWDVIVIDEAQNVADRQRQAQRSRLAKLLADRSDALIMLSATPHDGRGESFASLMNMLDPTAIANPGDYSKEDIKGLCVRRFKKDVQNQINEAFKERKVTLEKCQATPVEEEAFGLLANLRLNMDIGPNRLSAMFFKTILEKSIFSSPAACLQTLEERLKKLDKLNPSDYQADINQLTALQKSVARIKPANFSRYQALLKLVNGKRYAWTRKSDDRLVIFTERIETMRFLTKGLKQDLGLLEDQVVEMYGGFSDARQREIVENFGRKASPIRILVATDVASEGLNLHYLCHRVIHFDIPWSLMVFQQRNGRVDRYGQKESPDIRYFLNQSENPKINGDLWLLEILCRKEEQALKNLGDPAILMGKFSVQEEEERVGEAMQNSIPPERFESELSEFDPLEFLLASTAQTDARPEIIEDKTLFTDLEYAKTAIAFFSRDGQYAVKSLKTVEGIEIEAPEDSDLISRLKVLMPEEIEIGTYLRLSSDKKFVMDEIERCLQNSLSATAWPATQYLWPLHPLFSWINEKTGILFGRNEAPLLALPKGLEPSESLFLLSCTISNRKSAPVVDHWFGLLFKNKTLAQEMGFVEALKRAGLIDSERSNPSLATDETVQTLTALIPTVMKEAKNVVSRLFTHYGNETKPIVASELEKLRELYKRHLEYQKSLQTIDKKSKEKVKDMPDIEKMFKSFTKWVEESLTTENTPYLRIIAVLTGGQR